MFTQLEGSGRFTTGPCLAELVASVVLHGGMKRGDWGFWTKRSSRHKRRELEEV